jgi:uncharacterized protein (DUF362 family)
MVRIEKPDTTSHLLHAIVKIQLLKNAVPFMVDNGAGHFIQIGLRKTGLVTPARLKTLHDLDLKVGSYLLGVTKIFTPVKPGDI